MLIIITIRCQYKRHAVGTPTAFLEHDVNWPDLEEVDYLLTRRAERQPTKPYGRKRMYATCT
jgi:hypothetical protein